MLSDILPTAMECGVLDGRVHPGSSVAIVGCGPIGLAALLTAQLGVDTAIEAVDVPATFELCQQIVAAGGTIANIGVHGIKVDLHRERLWDRNITITTRLVDTVSTPMLLETLHSHQLDLKPLITHRFQLDDIIDAYDAFAHAAGTHALKVLVAA